MSLKNVFNLSVVLSAVDKMTPAINSAVSKATTAMNRLSAQTSRLGDKAMSLGQSAGVLGVGLGAALAVPIKSAMEFETGMTNIRKVVEGLEGEAAFKGFSDQVLALGRELPIAYDELTAMVAASGRMGIAKDKLIDYTREVGKMALAFEMPAELVGSQMGKISNIFSIATDDVGKLGDAINKLDDTSSAAGKDIIDVLLRTGGTANMLGLSAEKTAALATAMLSLGSTSETSGTAINAFFNKLATATKGNKDFQMSIGTIGMNSADIERGMIKDAQGTIVKVMEAMQKVAPEKRIQVASNLFGGEYFDDAAKLSAGLKTYTDAISTIEKKNANGKLGYIGSMDKEFEKRMKTSAAQMGIFKNNVQELAITLGTTLLPALNSVMSGMRPYVAAATQWIEQNPAMVSAITTVVASLTALSVGVAGVSFVFGGLLKTVSIMSSGISLLGSAYTGLGTVLIFTQKVFKTLAVSMMLNYQTGGILAKVLRVLAPLFSALSVAIGFVTGALKVVWALMVANPIGAVVVAIAAAVYIIYQYWEPISEFFVNLWEGVKNIFWGVVQWLGGLGATMYNAGVNLMTSLWNGLKSIAGAVWETITAPFDYISGWLGGEVSSPTLSVEQLQTAQALSQPMGGAGGGSFWANTAPTPIPQGTSSKSATTNTVMFQPTVNISGTMTPEDQKRLNETMGRWNLDINKTLDERERNKQRKSFSD